MPRDVQSYHASQLLVAARFALQVGIHCALFWTLKVLFSGPLDFAPTFNFLQSSVAGGSCALDLLTRARLIAAVYLRLLIAIGALDFADLEAPLAGFRSRLCTFAVGSLFFHYCRQFLIQSRKDSCFCFGSCSLPHAILRLKCGLACCSPSSLIELLRF